MEVEFGESFTSQAASSSEVVEDEITPTKEHTDESELTSEDDLPFDSTQLSSLIDILGKKGSVRREVDPAEEVSTSPFHILQRLFGPICERVATVCVGVNTYDEVVVKATHVLSTAPTRVFTGLESRGVGNNDFENELVFFETCDEPLKRSSPVIATLMNDLAPLRICDRQALSAQFLTIVHAIKDIAASQLDDIAFVMGDDKKIKRRTNVEIWRAAVEKEDDVLRTLVLGEFNEVYKRAFIYEVLAALVAPNLGLLDFTNMIFKSEFHVVRAALDAVNPKTLFICALSEEYIDSVWLPYMKLYYPRMFEGHKETAPAVTWTSLAIYKPEKKHRVDKVDDQDLSILLTKIFQSECSKDFLQSIKHVDAPLDYHSFRSDVFEGCGVRPKRAGIARKNYNESKKKQRK